MSGSQRMQIGRLSRETMSEEGLQKTLLWNSEMDPIASRAPCHSVTRGSLTFRSAHEHQAHESASGDPHCRRRGSRGPRPASPAVPFRGHALELAYPREESAIGLSHTLLSLVFLVKCVMFVTQRSVWFTARGCHDRRSPLPVGRRRSCSFEAIPRAGCWARGGARTKVGRLLIHSHTY